MRHIAFTLAAIGLILALAQSSQAGGDEAAAIIDKAIEAHGIKGKTSQAFAYRGKNKGTLHVGGLDLEFTQQVAVQTPDKFKEVLDLNVNDQKVTVTTVFDGKQGWIKANDTEIKVEKELLNEFKEVAHLMRLSVAMFLKDKALKYSLLGETKVNGKPAVGIQVSAKGNKDIDFYLDKATGLLAKIQRRAFDSQSGQEVTEERIIKDYHVVDGLKIAKNVEVRRDGQPLLEAEAVEAHVLERIDDSEFVKPG